MICPHCRKPINPAAIMGSKGGATTGASKRRDVDYADLARKAAKSRKANRLKATREQ